MNAKLRIVSRESGEPVNLDRLARMRPHELQQLHRKIFGSDLPSRNSEQARRRIAWQVQATREGGLPESARQHALGIAREAGLRIRARTGAKQRKDDLPHATVTGIVSNHDPRLPMPGTVIVKEYRGRTILVHALDEGFEYDGRRFTSLSAIATEITGTKWNGLLFFGLAKARDRGR
jgi:Protein of unknown function (DUF2924)